MNGFRVNGNQYGKCAAPAELTFHLDVSAMSSSNVRDERQAEAGTRDQTALVRRSAVELLEDALLFIGREAESAVGNFDHCIAVARQDTEIDFTCVAGIFHSVR